MVSIYDKPCYKINKTMEIEYRIAKGNETQLAMNDIENWVMMIKDENEILM